MNSDVVAQLATNSACIQRMERRTTGGILLAYTCLALLGAIGHTADGVVEDDVAKVEARKQEMGHFLPQLRSLEDAYSENSEIQLGLAVLYREYGPSPEFFQRGKRQLDRIVSRDVENRVAWAMLAVDTATLSVARGRYLADWLEKMVENSKGRGESRIEIGPGDAELGLSSPLYAIFGDETHKTVVIEEKDYDQARAQLRRRVESEMEDARSTVERAEKHDPENALYSYLKAHLFLELGQPAEALKELRAAVHKPSLRTYLEERHRAVAKALEAANAPATLKSYPEPFSPIGDYMQLLIWRRHLQPLAGRSEREGNFQQAKEIYELSIGMATKIREESFSSVADYNKSVSDHLERWAREHLSALAMHGDVASPVPKQSPRKE